MWNKGFFIGGINGSGGGSSGCEGLISIDGNNVGINIPLDLYINDTGEVFAGSGDNNAMLIYVSENEIYARKVE